MDTMTSTPMTETEYYDYYSTYYPDYTDTATNMTDPPLCRDAACVVLAVISMIIFILGVAGNGLVIWVAGFKMKKMVNTTWYLSLAVSDLLFCASLPFTVVYRVKNDWIFGLFMCKFISFIMFLNMFSSIFLLVIISVDRCVAVMFPVWAQNQRTIRKASVIVVLVWIISAVFSTPSLKTRDIQLHPDNPTNICLKDYMSDQEDVAIVLCRFIFGFMIPFLIIIISYIITIIRKLKVNQSARSNKPFKIMTGLIVTFFICWIPYHIFALMELNYNMYTDMYINILHVGEVVGVTLATANSCLYPFIYVFMGKDVKRRCCALLSKIENAFEEEETGQNTA